MTKVGLYAIGKSTTLESNKSLHDKRIAEAMPYPLPAGSRLLQDLGFLALTLPQVEILCRPRNPAARS